MTCLRKIDHGVKCNACGQEAWMSTVRPDLLNGGGSIRQFRDTLRVRGWVLGMPVDNAEARADHDFCGDCVGKLKAHV